MGTVVLGKLESGCIGKAQQLIMMPNRVRLYKTTVCMRECPSCFVRYKYNMLLSYPLCWMITVNVWNTVCSYFPAHGGGVESSLWWCGDGLRRAWWKPEAPAQRHWGGRDSPRFYPMQCWEPLPLRAHFWCPGNDSSTDAKDYECYLIFFERTNGFFLRFCSQIVIIEHKSIICPGYNAVLHIHTCIEEVQITVSHFVCTYKTFRCKGVKHSFRSPW